MLGVSSQFSISLDDNFWNTGYPADGCSCSAGFGEFSAIKGTPIRPNNADARRRPWRPFGRWMDITVIAKAEEHLRAAERELQLAIDAAKASAK